LFERGPMISLKRYLDSAESDGWEQQEQPGTDLLSAVVAAYGETLAEMGNCSVEACPGLGDGLKRKLGEYKGNLSTRMSREAVAETDCKVRDSLRNWGQETSRHLQQKACEVKELLLAVARTAESVSARDQRSADQMSQVTGRLKAIASLEDLTEIRSEIEKSTTELKTSIDRMTEEGKAVVDQLRRQVENYHNKLEEAELLASRDALTKLNSRHYVERQIQRRIDGKVPFCVAMIDVDGFKKVNDEHGHRTGDEMLKQFGAELRAACRTTDVIGRWGGDEFIVLFDCGLEEAEARAERISKWICGNYTVQGRSGELKLQMGASLGLAAHAAGEEMEDLLARADAAMYEQKASARVSVA